jgi:hypothetical protein
MTQFILDVVSRYTTSPRGFDTLTQFIIDNASIFCQSLSFILMLLHIPLNELTSIKFLSNKLT